MGEARLHRAAGYSFNELNELFNTMVKPGDMEASQRRACPTLPSSYLLGAAAAFAASPVGWPPLMTESPRRAAPLTSSRSTSSPNWPIKKSPLFMNEKRSRRLTDSLIAVRLASIIGITVMPPPARPQEASELALPIRQVVHSDLPKGTPTIDSLALPMSKSWLRLCLPHPWSR